VEAFCFFHQPILDVHDYKSAPASFKLMPPVTYSPFEQTGEQFASPSSVHWCGTDSLNRDIASRMLHGARTSLNVGFVAEGISIAIGTLVGAMAGYYRKGWDIILSRCIEVMECFPTFFLILTIIAFLPPSLFYIMIVIGLTSWTGVARLVRGEFLRLSVQPFTQAALATGAGDWRVIIRHILPNAMGPILVTATFGIASAILVESSLSFLGFGVPPPLPSWGEILSESRKYIDFAWWLATFPGIAIFVTITAYNLVGEGLRDAIDPRLRI
jgi:peptide/nickel transport system permease protein